MNVRHLIGLLEAKDKWNITDVKRKKRHQTLTVSTIILKDVMYECTTVYWSLKTINEM